MEEMAKVLQKLNNRLGVACGSENETEEQRLERDRENCQWLCDRENRRAGDLNLVDGYDCQLCNNKGMIAFPELYLGRYRDTYRTCKCMTIRKTIRALKRSGLESVVHDYTFDKYIATEPWQQSVLGKAKAYLANEQQGWFYFGGATGSGKTHICTAVAVALLKRGLEVKYMLWRDEASRLKAMVNDLEYAEVMRKYKDADVLYIDDLFKTGKTETQGRQRPTQADINLAFEILNARVLKKKITIISSECTLTDLIDIDEAVAGRIKQMCGEYCLNIAPDRSKNYRLK